MFLLLDYSDIILTSNNLVCDLIIVITHSPLQNFFNLQPVINYWTKVTCLSTTYTSNYFQMLATKYARLMKALAGEGACQECDRCHRSPCNFCRYCRVGYKCLDTVCFKGLTRTQKIVIGVKHDMMQRDEMRALAHLPIFPD